MTELNAEQARRAIVEHTRRLAESAAAAGPDTVVPTAPKWTVADLVEHVGQTLQWLATDAGAWLVERRPEGATWRPETRQADVTVSGPAQSLLLTLTRRRPLADREATGITVDGDIALAQHWLDNTGHDSD